MFASPMPPPLSLPQPLVSLLLLPCALKAIISVQAHLNWAAGRGNYRGQSEWMRLCSLSLRLELGLWGLLHRWAPELQHGHWLKTRHRHWFQRARVPGAAKVISALSIANHKMKCTVPPQRVAVVKYAQLNRNHKSRQEENEEHIYGPSGPSVMNRKQSVKMSLLLLSDQGSTCNHWKF